MTYFGFCLVFFGGLDFSRHNFVEVDLGLLDCIVSATLATLSFLDLRRFSNSSTGNNLNGVCATIWFWPSEPTGWLCYIILITTYYVTHRQQTRFVINIVNIIMNNIPMKFYIARFSFMTRIYCDQPIVLMKGMLNYTTNDMNPINISHLNTRVIEHKSQIDAAFRVLE